MQKCKELSRLGKSKSQFSSLLFRKQTPAAASAIAPLERPQSILDPTHPAVSMIRRKLPQTRNNVFGVTAIPFGLLEPDPVPNQEPFDIPIETWAQRVARSVRNSTAPPIHGVPLAPAKLLRFQQPRRLSMSLVAVVGKKATSKRKVVRLRIINKMKTAFYLAVVRTAQIQNGKLVFDTGASRQHLIHQGWTYSFYPQLEVYRMPYNELIPEILRALTKIHHKIVELETSWAHHSFTALGYKLTSSGLPQHGTAGNPTPTRSPAQRSAPDIEHRNRRLLDAEINELDRINTWAARRGTQNDVQTNYRSTPPVTRRDTQNDAQTDYRSTPPDDIQTSFRSTPSLDQDSCASYASSPPDKSPIYIRRSRESLINEAKGRLYLTQPILGNVALSKEKFRFKDSVSQRDRQKREQEKAIALRPEAEELWKSQKKPKPKQWHLNGKDKKREDKKQNRDGFELKSSNYNDEPQKDSELKSSDGGVEPHRKKAFGLK